MPRCIYCALEKPQDQFEPEHVLSRALAGSGNNLTLTDSVCAACNRYFSRYEAHWFRQAFEAMARNFHGPVSRNEKRDRTDRQQPVEIDGLYFIQHSKDYIYEGGFAFPNEPHLRPQCIDTKDGIVAIASTREDGEALRAAFKKLKESDKLEISVPTKENGENKFYICEVSLKRGDDICPRIASWRKSDKPSGLWLRRFADREKDSFENKCWTTRIALDHRGRLYMRAANIETAVQFFGLKMAAVDQDTKETVEGGSYTIAMLFEIDLNYVFASVMKTGFNFFCYAFGPDAALSESFDKLRSILMDKTSLRSEIRKYCKIDTFDGPDFPKASNANEHRMQIDLIGSGIVQFRLRLFDAFGYVAHLGSVPPSLAKTLGTRRLRIFHEGRGAEEVTSW